MAEGSGGGVAGSPTRSAAGGSIGSGGPFRDILVVDLLGGLGDLVMVLPVVHALARRNPGARLRLLTHAPGDLLVGTDPAVTEVRRASRGAERAAVRAELDRRQPDLTVSTTRYDGIAEEIESRGGRWVTDLWRRPPADQPVTDRYLRILAAEGLIDAADVATRPAIHLTAAEQRVGDEALHAALHTAPGTRARPGPPVVLIPGAGMAVKRWPHWAGLVAGLVAAGRPALVVAEPDAAGAVPDATGPETRPEPDGTKPDGTKPDGTRPDGTGTGGTGAGGASPWAAARVLPAVALRELAALFAAVGRRGGVVVGPDTGPLRVAAAVGARTVGLFGPTLAARYGLPAPAVDLQGLPGCTHRRPTAITEQVCWWEARCPLSADGPACMADVPPDAVLRAVLDSRLGSVLDSGLDAGTGTRPGPPYTVASTA